MKLLHSKFFRKTINSILITVCTCILLSTVCIECKGIESNTIVEFTEQEINETINTAKIDYQYINLPSIPEKVNDYNTIKDIENIIASYKTVLLKYKVIYKSIPEAHPQKIVVKSSIIKLQKYIDEYTEIIDNFWESRETSMPNMTYVWKYLTSNGLSEEVTAGIIGNMCAEVGGCGYGDLDAYTWDYATGRQYYGVCQWSIYYVPSIANNSLEDQLIHLLNSYEEAFNLYGYLYSYRYGQYFSFNEFLEMTSPYEAAIAFALCYERCASIHVEMRGPLAEKTYQYFTIIDSWPWH